MIQCQVCSVVESKYKCPTCNTPYCSVPCFKQHKSATTTTTTSEDGGEVIVDVCRAAPLPPAVVDPLPSEEVAVFTTPETLTADKLKELGNSTELVQLLSNPHLQQFLNKIDTSENPARLMRKAMHEPLMIEFVDACLRVVDPQQEELTDEQVLEAVQQDIENASS